MSCNPSIGGIGKGHLVREIDALDGIMGRVIDDSGIHFKMLNLKKGPAVRGPRAQADRDLYKKEMFQILSTYPNLHIVEGSAEDLIIETSLSGKKVLQGLLTKDGDFLFESQVDFTSCKLSFTTRKGNISISSSNHNRNISARNLLSRKDFVSCRKTHERVRRTRAALDWSGSHFRKVQIPRE